MELKALLVLFRCGLDEGGEAGSDVAVSKYMKALLVPTSEWT